MKWCRIWFWLSLSHISTEGYAAGHCPYLDQCVFTHMDAQDVLAWLKVVDEYKSLLLLKVKDLHLLPQEDFNRHYLTNKAPYTLAMHTNWFQEENQVLNIKRYSILYKVAMALTTFKEILLYNAIGYFVATLLFSERCSQWVLGLVGGEGWRVLRDWNSGDCNKHKWNLECIIMMHNYCILKAHVLFSGTSLDDWSKASEPDKVGETLIKS